ncbi:hypothetical protein J5Y04_40540 [Kitasatospora sp. RG8]|nr:hypothetical protein [Kitasatospora sp. RG8]MBP0455767.1 hypothetical protein [Kitasatospora sp. RG8]
MLETDTVTAAYSYGENKSGDAADFGMFEQNGPMPRSACGTFAGQGAGYYPGSP